MASTYSLPSAAIPTHHHHSSEHLHHHSNSSLSQSPPKLSYPPPKPDENRPLGASLGSSRRQSLGHRHSQTHDGHRANTHLPRPTLPTIPSSAEIPNDGGHWRKGSTAGGRPLITPTHASFDAAALYQPPDAHDHHDHDHDHHHNHDHGHDHHHDHHHVHDHAHDHSHATKDHTAKRSRFTGLLLPYTSKYPLLHAIMTDKDSRRIFYFMSYVYCPPLHETSI